MRCHIKTAQELDVMCKNKVSEQWHTNESIILNNSFWFDIVFIFNLVPAQFKYCTAKCECKRYPRLLTSTLKPDQTQRDYINTTYGRDKNNNNSRWNKNWCWIINDARLACSQWTHLQIPSVNFQFYEDSMKKYILLRGLINLLFGGTPFLPVCVWLF